MTQARVEDALKHYPLNVKLAGKPFTIHVMTSKNGPTLLKFANSLPHHDLLFLRRDITQQEGVDKWMRDIERGVMYSLICEDQDGVVGYSTIHLTDLGWSSHVADLRVMTGPRARGVGLGRLLTREAFNIALALGIEKIVARMTPDQQGARALFQELGFQPEALLKNEVKDRDGEYHDLLIMAVDVQTFLASRQAYGIAS